MKYKENAEIIKKYLDDNDWHYDMKDHGVAVVFRGGVSVGKSVFSSFQFTLAVEDDVVQNFVTLPVSAREKLAEIAEFVVRVNYPLKRGRMDLDISDGEVRYHICVPAAAVQADPNGTIEDVLCLPSAMLIKYGKGIAEILFNGVDAKTAYEHCEA